MKIDTWVLARDASGAPDIVPVRLDCSEQDMQDGRHYEVAMTRAAELGYEPMGAFDERDPAGTKMLRLMNFEGWRKQERVPGDAAQPLWTVPLTVDMTLSATVLAHGGDPSEVVRHAAEFAASAQGHGMFSLDECNYRGPSDFYCADPEQIERVAPQDVAGALAAVQEAAHAEDLQPWGADPTPPLTQWDLLGRYDISSGIPPLSAEALGPQVVGDSDASESRSAGSGAISVVKTVLEVTVLHEQALNMDNFSLGQIAGEIEGGDWLGAVRVLSAQPVLDNDLHAQQVALGNDGTFFVRNDSDDSNDSNDSDDGGRGPGRAS
jgi:hypothetical protein